MSPYRMQYRIRKGISSLRADNNLNKFHYFLEKDLLLILRTF